MEQFAYQPYTLHLIVLLCAGIPFTHVCAATTEDHITSVQKELRELRTEILGRIEKLEEAIKAMSPDSNDHHQKCKYEVMEVATCVPTTAAETISGRLGRMEGILKDFTADAPPQILFAGTQGAVYSYSWATSAVKMVASLSVAELQGVAYDSLRNLVYVSAPTTINQLQKDGKQLKAVFSSNLYGQMRGLSFDWITGNLYGVTAGGYIIICKAKTDGMLACVTALSGQGFLNGITVNPIAGLVFYTSNSGLIVQAEMDGSNPTPLVATLINPHDIKFDFGSSKLYWADYFSHKIQSCNVNGTGIQTLVQLPDGAGPVGLALLHDRVYWGNYVSKAVQSSRKDGTDIQTLFTGADLLEHMVTTTLDLPQDRINHCEQQQCAFCVLTTQSFRCLYSAQ